MLLQAHRLRAHSQCPGAAMPHIICSTRHPERQGAVRWAPNPTPTPCARLERLLGADGRAGQHHLARRLQAHQARQPLRAAKARQDAQLQLRQAQLGACAAAGGEACQELGPTRCRRAASCKRVHSVRTFQVRRAGTKRRQCQPPPFSVTARHSHPPRWVAAPGEHSRALHARAVSRPPPRATPSMAATVGLGPLSSSSQKLSLILCSRARLRWLWSPGTPGTAGGAYGAIQRQTTLAGACGTVCRL